MINDDPLMIKIVDRLSTKDGQDRGSAARPAPPPRMARPATAAAAQRTGPLAEFEAVERELARRGGAPRSRAPLLTRAIIHPFTC